MKLFALDSVLFCLTKCLLSILLISCTSCNYEYVALKRPSGKKVWYRAYNTTFQQQVYNEKQVFRWRHPVIPFEHCLSPIEEVIIDSVTYVQTDTMRLRLATPEVRLFSPLFTSGLLHGALFSKEESAMLAPVSLYYVTDSAGKPHMPCKGNWCGHTLNIGLVEEPDYLRVSPKCRRFKLWVMNDSGRNGYSNFFVEIRNEQVNRYVPIAEFVEKASVTFIASTGYAL